MNHILVDYLSRRRSIPVPQLKEPGPDAETLRAILTIAVRVPDHGKLAPWRFILYPAAERKRAVESLTEIAGRHPDAREAALRAEKAKTFAEAPLVIGVASSPQPDHPKIPLWEQHLSAEAVGLNLLHAAEAHGFSAQWRTGWYAYDEEAKSYLGFQPGEQVAGFVFIGTPAMPPTERDRPDVEALTTEWHA